MLDIGLNVGPYALLARSCSDREVVGFEPTPDLAHIARVTGARNGLPYRVEEIALGDSEGTATLYLSDTSDSSNSLNPDFRPNHTSIEVPLETLDSYVARTGVVPGLLKVDTETTEPAVLRGAARTVAEHRPWVFCEVLHGRGEDDLTRAIADWGYTWYHLTGPGPLEPAEAIVGDKAMQHFMWLFVPEPARARALGARRRLATRPRCDARRTPPVTPRPGSDMQPHVVMLVSNDVSTDTRVKKVALAVARMGLRVTVLGITSEPEPSVSALGPVTVVRVPVDYRLREARRTRRETARRWRPPVGYRDREARMTAWARVRVTARRGRSAAGRLKSSRAQGERPVALAAQSYALRATVIGRGTAVKARSKAGSGSTGR